MFNKCWVQPENGRVQTTAQGKNMFRNIVIFNVLSIRNQFLTFQLQVVFLNVSKLFQRYRKDEEESNSDNDYEPYIPVRERKRQELLKLGRLTKVIGFIIVFI